MTDRDQLDRAHAAVKWLLTCSRAMMGAAGDTPDRRARMASLTVRAMDRSHRATAALTPGVSPLPDIAVRQLRDRRTRGRAAR